MKRIKLNTFKLVLLIITGFNLTISQGQTITYDTSYWFAIPSTAHAYRTDSRFLIATYNLPATVTLSIPANASFTPKTITVTANSTGVISFTNNELGIGPNTIWGYPSILYNDPNASPLVNNIDNSISNTGILITSTARITIYYESGATTNSPDFTSLKGRQAMGTSFIVPMQESFNVRNFPNQSNRDSKGKHGFLVTATEDNTLVTIVPKIDITGHLAGIPFNILLHRGQTYFAQIFSTAIPVGASGSTVVSDKPIVISIYADQMQKGQSFDLGMEQIVPISSLGRDYFVVRGDLSTNEIVYITAVNDNTTVLINGAPISSTLTANQTHIQSIPKNSSGILIQASSEISVLHLSGRGEELAYSLIPALNGCRGVTSSTLIRSQAGSSQAFIITVLAQAPEGFLINNSPTILVASDFSPTGIDGWWYARKNITNNIPNTSGAIIEITNSNAGKFHIGAIHGEPEETGSRYGYFTEYSEINVTAGIEGNQTICYNEDLQLKLEITITPELEDNLTYYWTGPNGFTSYSPNPIIYNLNASKSGVYTVIVTSGECSNTSSVTINARPCKMITNPMIISRTIK